MVYLSVKLHLEFFDILTYELKIGTITILKNDVLSNLFGFIIRISLSSTVISALTSTTSRSWPVWLLKSQLKPVRFCVRFSCTKSTGYLFCLLPGLLHDILSFFACYVEHPESLPHIFCWETAASYFD